MADGLAGGWIEPALDGGSIFDAAILAISSLPFAWGEGVEYLSSRCLLRTFRVRLATLGHFCPMMGVGVCDALTRCLGAFPAALRALCGVWWGFACCGILFPS